MAESRGGAREGAGRVPLAENERKTGYKIYLQQSLHEDIEEHGVGSSFSEKVVDLVTNEIDSRKISKNQTVKFIDLFAGLGGIRLGFEQAFRKVGFKTECVMTSEIKPHAIRALNENFEHKNFYGDITQVENRDIPNFDFLLAGFPCQAFSSAGKGHGFLDTRGTLFFEVARILKEKKPYGFILENVEGLVTHDKKEKEDKIGQTLSLILTTLNELNYKVNWKILDSKCFGVPQSRKRIYIVGTRKERISLERFPKKKKTFGEVMEHGIPTVNTPFSALLFQKYKPEQLYGKSIKDKRGGTNNIHSWDLNIKGEVSSIQKNLLETLLKERRKKQWAIEIGIDWMDGMPLTYNQIATFFDCDNLKEVLDDLLEKGYLTFEHPKSKVQIHVGDNKFKIERKPDLTKPKGYNIVSGKLSFEFSKIIDPESVAPTLVAMDVSTLGVIDNGGIRQLTLREGLSLFGYPDNYSLECFNDNCKNINLGFDLLGNTITVPAIEAIAIRVANSYLNNKKTT